MENIDMISIIAYVDSPGSFHSKQVLPNDQVQRFHANEDYDKTSKSNVTVAARKNLWLHKESGEVTGNILFLCFWEES